MQLVSVLRLCFSPWAPVNWKDVLADKAAWDTVVWFGVIISLATGLTSLGFIKWMSAGFASIANRNGLDDNFHSPRLCLYLPPLRLCNSLRTRCSHVRSLCRCGNRSRCSSANGCSRFAFSPTSCGASQNMPVAQARSTTVRDSLKDLVSTRSTLCWLQ